MTKILILKYGLLAIAWVACLIYALSFFLPIGWWFDNFCTSIANAYHNFIGLPWHGIVTAILFFWACLTLKWLCDIDSKLEGAAKYFMSIEKSLEYDKPKNKREMAELSNQISKLRQDSEYYEDEIRKLKELIAVNPEVQTRSAVQSAVSDVMGSMCS